MWTEILSTEGQKDSRQDTGNGMGRCVWEGVLHENARLKTLTSFSQNLSISIRLQNLLSLFLSPFA